jgi:hypothetical protein
MYLSVKQLRLSLKSIKTSINKFNDILSRAKNKGAVKLYEKILADLFEVQQKFEKEIRSRGYRVNI